MIISATKLLTFHTYTEAQYAAHQVRPFRRSVDIHPRWWRCTIVVERRASHMIHVTGRVGRVLRVDARFVADGGAECKHPSMTVFFYIYREKIMAIPPYHLGAPRCTHLAGWLRRRATGGRRCAERLVVVSGAVDIWIRPRYTEALCLCSPLGYLCYR